MGIGIKAGGCECRFSKKAAHARLPWLRLQRLAPSEAPILLEARSAYQTPAAPSGLLRPPPPPPSRSLQKSASQLDQQISPPGGSQGPLLLFPDTSALLVLIGAVPAFEPGRLGLQSLQVSNQPPSLILHILSPKIVPPQRSP